MKYILIGLAMIAGFKTMAQPRAAQLLDSLTNLSSRTWHRQEGTAFTTINGNCSNGLEMVFVKAGKTVKLRQCVNGNWNEHQYNFNVVASKETHYVEILQNNKVLHQIEMQVFGTAAKFNMELTFYNLQSAEYYNLVSK